MPADNLPVVILLNGARVSRKKLESRISLCMIWCLGADTIFGWTAKNPRDCREIAASLTAVGRMLVNNVRGASIADVILVNKHNSSQPELQLYVMVFGKWKARLLLRG